MANTSIADFFKALDVGLGSCMQEEQSSVLSHGDITALICQGF